jgi:cytochrome c556
MSSWKTPGLAVMLFALAAGAGAAGKAASMKDEMKAVVRPASDALFAVGGEVDPANGPEAAKVSSARWAEAAAAAAKLATVAAHLQQPAQAKDKGAWMDLARRMAQQSAAAGSAAKAHQGAALAQAANDLSDTCSACHAKYRPKS